MRNCSRVCASRSRADLDMDLAMKPTFEFAARRFLMGAACSSSCVLSSLVAAGVAERDFNDSL